MRPKLRLIALLALLTLALPASARLAVDSDPDADFAAYRTYAWREGSPVANDLVHRRVLRAVDEQLAAAGLKKVEGEADLYVTYHLSLDRERRVNVDEFGYPGYWRGWSAAHVNVYDVNVGALLVDMLDGNSGNLVWRGLAEGDVSDNPERNQKRLSKVVRKLFRKYPPK